MSEFTILDEDDDEESRDKLTIIDNDEESRDKFDRLWGDYEYVLSENDIRALFDGKVLAGHVNDEFTIFITLERKGQ